MNHRTAARFYLWTGMAFLLLGGLIAMLMRYQWGWPGNAVPLYGRALTPESYQALFTLHGLIMIFFAITPILIGGVGNLVVPLQVGAGELAFPRVTLAAVVLFACAGALLVASPFMDFLPGAGWTMYPPLSTVALPGHGQTLVIAAVLVASVSTVLTALNLVVTVIRGRAPGMKFFRMPLTTWGFFLSSALSVLFAPVLTVGTALLLLDRVGGTAFFTAGAAAAAQGDPLLYQHLFWLFGHPEVYILILPVWGVVGDLVSWFSRKPAFWYRGQVFAMMTVAALSGSVYAHHMFLAGLSPLLGRAFMALTLAISFPAQVLFLNWLLTLWRGSLRMTTPMLFALGTLFVFGIGGLTGLVLGTVATDIYLHDTMYVVGHFHLTMAAATFLGSFAAVHFWFPHFFGTMLNERLGKAHFWSTTVLLVLVFAGQLLAGYGGQQRRLFDPYAYESLQGLLNLNQWTSTFAFVLAGAQLLFIGNLVWTLWRRPHVDANPWKVGTLEWAPASGAVVNGPHELSNPAWTDTLGRDWIGQTERA